MNIYISPEKKAELIRIADSYSGRAINKTLVVYQFEADTPPEKEVTDTPGFAGEMHKSGLVLAKVEHEETGVRANKDSPKYPMMIAVVCSACPTNDHGVKKYDIVRAKPTYASIFKMDRLTSLLCINAIDAVTVEGSIATPTPAAKEPHNAENVVGTAPAPYDTPA